MFLAGMHKSLFEICHVTFGGLHGPATQDMHCNHTRSARFEPPPEPNRQALN